MTYNTSYPSLVDLKDRTRKRIPKFAFDFLEGGCTDENSLNHNATQLQQVRLNQKFIRPRIAEPNIKASFCGHRYDAPFGIAPIGFQGIVWGNISKILARTAKDYNIPYMLSTFATSTIEEIGEVSEGTAIFQLYNPNDEHIRKDLLKRAQDCNYRALVVTVDIASQSYRPRELRNGMIPPKMSIKNAIEVLRCPTWAFNMLMHEGIPGCNTLTPYLASKTVEGMRELRTHKMQGAMSFEDLQHIRDLWDGPLVIKGILSEYDMDMAIKLGVDGVIVSNHGARQLDNGTTSIAVLPALTAKYGNKMHISFDSGIQSGCDIAAALASGAKFTFLGRAFCYGVGALGQTGAGHTIEMLTQQLNQVLCQIGCQDIKNAPDFLIK